MFSNFKRVISLTLLAGAAGSVLAEPAPVSDLNSGNATTTTTTSPSSSFNETDVQRLERLLENRNRVQLQMQQQLDEMALEISELRGQLEKNSYDMQQMLQRQRELFIELDKVRSQAAAPVIASQPEENQQAEGGTFSTNVDEQTAYQNAVDLILKKRDYTGAITALNQFQQDYPESTFTPNAHYWLGQLYFAKKQDKEAAKNFLAVIAFPESNKRADALVKLGDISKRNNNLAKATEYYQAVLDEYPSSSSAKLAEQGLQ